MSVTVRNPGEKWTAARANTKIEAPVLLSELAAEVTNAWEDTLGNPATNGYVLVSTAAGVRSWADPMTIGVGSVMTTLGDTLYGGAAGVETRLPGNTTAAKQFLTQTGTGAVSAAPAWGALTSGDVTGALTFTPFANPMTTAEDLIKGGASGAATRLAVGSNDQVLTVVAGVVTWAAATGGMTNPMTASGDMIYGGASGAPTRLAAGTNGHVLTLAAGVPTWSASTGGGIQVGDSPTLTGQWTWGNSGGADWRLRIWRADNAAVVGASTFASIQLAPWSRPTSGYYSGEIQWQIDPASSTYAPVVMGVYWDDSAVMGKGSLYVATRNSTASATAPTVRLFVTASGYLFLPTSSKMAIEAVTTGSGITMDVGKLSQSSLRFFEGGWTGNGQQITFGYHGAPTAAQTWASAAIAWVNTSNGTYGDLVFATRSVDTDTQPTERMRITAAGLVGIGITPLTGTMLHTKGPGLFHAAAIAAPASVGTELLGVYGNDQANTRIRIRNTTTNDWLLMVGVAGLSNDGFSIYDVIAGATRLYITETTGIVKFGSADNLYIDATNAMIAGYGNVVIRIDANNDQTSRIFQIQRDAGTAMFTIDEAGNAGLGTAAQVHRLSVTDAAGTIVANFWTSGASYINVSDNREHTAAGAKRLQMGVDPTAGYAEISSVDQGTGSWPLRLTGSTLTLAGAITLSGDVGIGAIPVTGVPLTITHATDSGFRLVKSNATASTAQFNNDGSLHIYSGSGTDITYLRQANLYFLSRDASTTWARVSSSGLFVGGSAYSTFATLGVTINQGANDNEILTFQSSDVTHGMTVVADTNTFGYFQKDSGTDGGLRMTGLADTGTRGIQIRAIGAGSEDSTRATTSNAYLVLNTALKNGTNVTGPSANTNILAILSGDTTRFIFDSDGDSHQDVGTAWTNFDAHDDVALLTALSAGVSRHGDPLREQFGSLLEASRETLTAQRIVTFNEDGHHFINWSRAHMLTIGAVRQTGMRLWALEEKVEDDLTLAKRRITELEREVAWLKYGLEERNN